MAQLPTQSQFGDYGDWPGRDVLDSGGERLGGVREIYLDRETGRPEWVLVDVDGSEARFVPLADAEVESSSIRVAHTATAIRNAPGIGSEPRIDQSEERQLYKHYGLGYSDEESGSGLPIDLQAQEPVSIEKPAYAPWRVNASEPDDTSSWSEAAAEDEPSNLAPPPGEPPSPAELDAAEIPEPPAVTERESDDDADVLAPAAIDPEPFSADAELPSPAVTGPIDEPAPFAPSVADEVTPAVATSEPEPVEAVFTPPATPNGAPSFARPPAPAAAPRPFTPPPPTREEPSRALAALKSRRGKIVAGVGIAALLFYIVRRLR